jgi:hypothetical protein
MASTIERPAFYEGQILAGADLNAGVDHARGQLARHERLLHLWGIADGLELKGRDRKTATGSPYQEVTVTAGMAVDGSGREVVVPAETRLPDEVFDQLNVSVGQLPGAVIWYPVFLTGRDIVPPAPPLSTGQCGSSEPNRMREDFQFDFGRPGDETVTADEAGVADGPDSGFATPRRVLLGFVRWDTALAKFVEVAPDHEGIGRRYAGTRADSVAARGGSLAMRTRSAVTKGKPGLALNETGNGFLAFGPLTAAGAIEPVFSVNAKGDLTIAGKFTGAVTPGSVQVQSGVAMDGLILPLPPGITQEMLDKGQATAHLQATTRVPPSAPPDGNPAGWLACPLECSVDSARRVRCRVRWFSPTVAASPVDLAGECDYVVLVSVAAA